MVNQSSVLLGKHGLQLNVQLVGYSSVHFVSVTSLLKDKTFSSAGLHHSTVKFCAKFLLVEVSSVLDCGPSCWQKIVLPAHSSRTTWFSALPPNTSSNGSTKGCLMWGSSPGSLLGDCSAYWGDHPLCGWFPPTPWRIYFQKQFSATFHHIVSHKHALSFPTPRHLWSGEEERLFR